MWAFILWLAVSIALLAFDLQLVPGNAAQSNSTVPDYVRCLGDLLLGRRVQHSAVGAHLLQHDRADPTQSQRSDDGSLRTLLSAVPHVAHRAMEEDRDPGIEEFRGCRKKCENPACSCVAQLVASSNEAKGQDK